MLVTTNPAASPARARRVIHVRDGRIVDSPSPTREDGRSRRPRGRPDDDRGLRRVSDFSGRSRRPAHRLRAHRRADGSPAGSIEAPAAPVGLARSRCARALPRPVHEQLADDPQVADRRGTPVAPGDPIARSIPRRSAPRSRASSSASREAAGARGPGRQRAARPDRGRAGAAPRHDRPREGRAAGPGPGSDGRDKDFRQRQLDRENATRNRQQALLALSTQEAARRRAGSGSELEIRALEEQLAAKPGWLEAMTIRADTTGSVLYGNHPWYDRKVARRRYGHPIADHRRDPRPRVAGGRGLGQRGRRPPDRARPGGRAAARRVSGAPLLRPHHERQPGRRGAGDLGPLPLVPRADRNRRAGFSPSRAPE